ncbi:MAG TPA: family 16 glycoside hydrolase, partial [Cellvibrionaceae bacterium]
MKTKNISLWRKLALACALSIPLLAVADAADYQRYFDGNDAWQKTQGATLRDGHLHAVAEGTDAILLSAAPELPNLVGNVNVGDSYVRLEYMLSEGAQAGIYLQGRYEIILSGKGNAPNAGTLGSRWDGNENAMVDGAPALKDAAKAAGKWQTLEVRFRAPRYDDASNKSDNALIIEAKINDQVVQQNTILPGFTQGSINPWETTQGPIMLRVTQGQLAVRDVQVRPADFTQVDVPAESGAQTNEAELEDFVARGKKMYNALGCKECHAVDKGDASMKTGPNLFGLFQKTPRDREIIEQGGSSRFTIKADYNYLHRSVREPAIELATIESEDRKGEAYLPIMPPYMEQTLPDKD